MAVQSINAPTGTPGSKTRTDRQHAASVYNPLYSKCPEKTAINLQSVLCFLHDYITKEDDPGIAEDRYPGAALVLKCAIQALDAQIEFGDLKRAEGGAA